MGGPSNNRSEESGGGGTYADQLKASQRKKKIADVLTPTPVKIIKAIIEAPEKNKKSKSGDVYGADEAKEKIDYKAPVKSREDNNRDNNPTPKAEPSKVETPAVEPPAVEPKEEVSIKSAEQPKAKSQMDNTAVKSDNIVADKTAPTDAEIALQNKRKGRKKTILTSVTGVEAYPTLSNRTLLGG